jgi:CRISPR-associated protein Cmr1
MKESSFKLQVVRPLFLSGARQQEAELRPLSIRGALRFWFRAMMGGVVGGDVAKVRKLEAAVWGTETAGSR